ncbi:hypothetical protein ACFMPD_03165, partial [Sedimentitalea sp. HM32M-2]|uniref:hypothetical protein n=1 Tax=Sedimentitalea sp. HM32M-2 TaxID=3351566 RepID=UPI00362AF69C
MQFFFLFHDVSGIQWYTTTLASAHSQRQHRDFVQKSPFSPRAVGPLDAPAVSRHNSLPRRGSGHEKGRPMGRPCPDSQEIRSSVDHGYEFV